MFCPNCGTNAPDGAKACPNCGTFLNAQPAAPVYQEAPAQQPIYNAAPVSTISYNTTPILVFGILALAFAAGFYTSIAGIIFGILTKKKVNEYLAQGGTLTGKAKVGSILGKVGLILGIVMTVALVIYIIVAVIASAALSAYSYY